MCAKLHFSLVQVPFLQVAIQHFKLFIFVYVYVPVYLCMCTTCVQYTWRPEEGIRSSEARVTGCDEPLDMGAGNPFAIRRKNKNNNKNLFTVELSLQFMVLVLH